MGKVSTVKARNEFSEVINRAAYGKERVVLTRRGKDVVAVVPIEDVKLLEEMEDRIDNEAADEAIAEAKAKGEKPIPWEKVKRDLGLK
jgi:prevent-host-death family protein